MNDDNMNNELQHGQPLTWASRAFSIRVRASLSQLTGKVQEGWGKLTGDKGDELKGKLKQGKGNVEEGLGQAETNVDSALDH